MVDFKNSLTTGELLSGSIALIAFFLSVFGIWRQYLTPARLQIFQSKQALQGGSLSGNSRNFPELSIDTPFSAENVGNSTATITELKATIDKNAQYKIYKPTFSFGEDEKRGTTLNLPVTIKQGEVLKMVVNLSLSVGNAEDIKENLALALQDTDKLGRDKAVNISICYRNGKGKEKVISQRIIVPFPVGCEASLAVMKQQMAARL